MAIDILIEQAVTDSIIDSGQPHRLSIKVIKWLENSMNDIEDPLDPSSYRTHLELIFNTMELENDEENY